MKHHLIAALGALLLVFNAAEAMAQGAQLSIAEPGEQIVDVVIDQAVVIQSDQPFGEISVAQPGIADVAGINDRSLYVLGKTPGVTTLTLLGTDGAVLAHVVVKVSIRSPDVAPSVRVRRGGEVSLEQVK